MSSLQTYKWFIRAVYKQGEHTGWPVNAWDVGKQLFGGDEESIGQSTVKIASDCKAAGLLLVSTDFREVYITREGLAFIGKE